MKIFMINRYTTAATLCETESQVVEFLQKEYQIAVDSWEGQSQWSKRSNVCADNLAANALRAFRVFEVDTDMNPSLYNLNVYNRNSEGVVDVTTQFFTCEAVQYEGLSRMLAEVSNTRAKSHGMTVAVDPQLIGGSVRPIEEYTSLIGTFSRIKATTNITGYGYATLFFAPESLTNFRIETAQINGYQINWIR